MISNIGRRGVIPRVSYSVQKVKEEARQWKLVGTYENADRDVPYPGDIRYLCINQ